MSETENLKESVQMEDGRVVAFSAKQKVLKESVIQGDSAQVRFDFRNGQVRYFDLSRADITRLACHGAEAKIGDEYAGVTDIDDCVLAVEEMIERLYRHEWAAQRAKGEAKGGSVLMQAIMEVKGLPADVVKQFLSKKTMAEKVALRRSPQFADVVARIEAEKAGKRANDIDLSDALAELDAL